MYVHTYLSLSLYIYIYIITYTLHRKHIMMPMFLRLRVQVHIRTCMYVWQWTCFGETWNYTSGSQISCWLVSGWPTFVKLVSGHWFQTADFIPGTQRFRCHTPVTPDCIQPILWNKYVPPEPAKTAKHSPESISEGGRIWQVRHVWHYGTMHITTQVRERTDMSLACRMLLVICSSLLFDLAKLAWHPRSFCHQRSEPSN